MQKPSEGIVRSDAGQRLNDRLQERFMCASAHAPQDRFQPGKGSLNRGKIGRVGGEKQQLAASSFNGLPHFRALMGREIVQDHDLPRAQVWRTVKYEKVYIHEYASPGEAWYQLQEHCEFYNHERPHQALDYQTLAEVYGSGTLPSSIES